MIGLPGSKAVGRLREAGYETIDVKGRWSNQRRGVILTENSGSARHDAVIYLVASMGLRSDAHGPIYFDGVATCELTPLAPGATCAGAPVILQASSS